MGSLFWGDFSDALGYDSTGRVTVITAYINVSGFPGNGNYVINAHCNCAGLAGEALSLCLMLAPMIEYFLVGLKTDRMWQDKTE